MWALNGLERYIIIYQLVILIANIKKNSDVIKYINNKICPKNILMRNTSKIRSYFKIINRQMIKLNIKA
ncbi:hypothetical protein YYC_01587 [Plasmodium yoelii 17X]|uniref:Uncharacterized protein n=1 Tax=Plasmodium yoelii 17X TaxID=1323249 RepID=V7PQ89_PLAYE|nr:hypothetical protein YYC_01587 [Plasmodium yoelii 17X]